jgi:predicted acyl esterase
MQGCRFAAGRVACGVCLLVLLFGGSTATAATVEQQGYIPMADGTQLEYTVELPADAGRFPVAMVYDGYCEGTGPLACKAA